MTQFERLATVIGDAIASGRVAPGSSADELAAALMERGVRVVDDETMARALLATDPFQFCEHTPRAILEALDSSGR